MPKQSRRSVSERKEIFSKSQSIPCETQVGDEMSPQYKFGSYCGKIQFKLEQWFASTVDLEHRLLELDERQLVTEDTVHIEYVHRKKSPGPSGVDMAGEERSRKSMQILDMGY